jgi:hypothetical protein
MSADLFEDGRKALALCREAFAGRAFFAGARRLRRDGSWSGSGSAEAALSLADEEALLVLGLSAAVQAGADTVVLGPDGVHFDEAIRRGLRCLVRVDLAADEPAPARAARLGRLAGLVGRMPGEALLGLLPTPAAEGQGLLTVGLFAACRLACPGCHILVDLDRLGHKLGQLCLSFGADGILGSVVAARELRLGARAGSHDLTHDEAAQLLRAAGFSACELFTDGEVRAP